MATMGDRSRRLLGQVGRRAGRRAPRRFRPTRPSAVDQVVIQPELPPQPRSAARTVRPTAAGRVTLHRLPDRSVRAENGDGVPKWIRKYGQMAWLVIGMVIVVGMVVFATTRIQAVFIAVFLGLVVTSVLDPIVTGLARYMPRALATALGLLGSFLVVAGLLTYVVTSVAGQWQTLADRFGVGINQILTWLETGPLPWHLTQAEVTNAINQAIDQATTYIQQNAGDLAGQVLSNAGAVALVFTVLALSLFVTIFFLARGGQMWRWFLNQLPSKNRERVHTAASAGWYTFSGYARGTMIVAFFDGILAFILLTIVGVPLAAPLAVLVFIGAFIPLIGAPIAMIVAAVVALAAEGVVAALIVTVGVALIGQIEGHILEPLVMGKQVSLHPVVVALGVASGTFLGGLLGAIIAIPLIAVVWAVYSALHQGDPPLEDPLPPVRRRGRGALEQGGQLAEKGRIGDDLRPTD
jgi:predicted PurR-regulated permease PerM